MALYMIFGLNTWLPNIMRSQGYSLGSSLMFVLILNLGAIIGNLLTGLWSDRWHSKYVVAFSFLCAFVSFGLLSLKTPIAITYLLIAVAGIGSMGTQNLVNAFVGKYYPTGSRATALGWSLGIGRFGGILAPIVGGQIAVMGVAAAWNFYAFAVAGILGLVAIAFVSIKATATAQSDIIPSAGSEIN